MAGNSVIAGLMVARLLGKDNLGTLAAISVSVSIVLQFGGFGLANANLYYAAQDKKHVPPAFINGSIFALISGVAFVAMTLILAPWLIPAVPIGMLSIALASIPFTLMTQMNLYLILGRGQIKTYNVLELVNQSFVLINAFVVLLILQSGLWELIIFNTAASALVAILVSVWLFKSIEGNREDNGWRVDRDLFRRMMAFAIKTNLTWVSTYLIYRLDLLIVSAYRGAGETAVYSVASQVTLLVLIAPTAVATMFQHRVARGDDEMQFSLRVFRYSSFLLLAVCLVTVPGSLLLKMLYGVGFDDLPIQVAILVPGIYCAGMQIVISQSLAGKALPVNVHTVWLVALAVNVLLNVAIVPSFGARGSAAISTFSYATVFIMILFLFMHKSSVKVSEIIVPRIGELKTSWLEFTRMMAADTVSRGGSK